jgi:FAD/FMN-containing dehydrogenase/Fe-S oxidoreductase
MDTPRTPRVKLYILHDRGDMDELIPEIVAKLESSITGEVKTDPVTRVLYSTDASIHKIVPMGVVFPRNIDELIPIVKLSNQYNIPLIPRGSGSSLAGQAVGSGVIIDCSRYVNRLVQINREEQTAIVEPGLILDDLNREAKKYNLRFGPDPASSERATLGGSIGNNATGAHSILYGMTADHIISAEVVLADGTVTNLKPISIDHARRIVNGVINTTSSNIEKQIYQSALQIQNEYQEDIKKSWPLTWRRVSGYNLNYLIPWSPTAPPQWDLGQIPYPPVLPNTINLAQLLAGSEGTLGIIRNATLRLVPLKKHTIISVINFLSIVDACEIVPKILKLSPSAVELIPQSLIHLARSVPAYANQLTFVIGDPAALLGVEFSSDDPQILSDQVIKLNKLCNWSSKPFIAETPEQQKQVWDVRNVGLGILMSRLGDYKPISFIEDMSVPVERLGEFIRELDIILNHYKTQADYYGHASAGCLHIRPLLNIKTQVGRAELRSIAEAAVDLVLRLGGAVSAEHGDGITRGEFIERAYGPRVIQAFRIIKHAADPQGILNPGKIVDPPKLDTSLRYDDEYHPEGWIPVMTFSSERPDSIRLVEAIEQCNGVGVCRKSGGVMCPSFQATKDEMYSTRGRANLLRAMISNGFSTQELATQAVRDTLEKCLACKGCKAECPSAVDMAKLKYEFYQHYYSLPGHHHPLRDYLFGYISFVAKIGHPFAPLVNYLISTPHLARFRETLVGLSKNRTLPQLSRKALHSLAKPLIKNIDEPDCLFLSDAFNEYFYPQTGLDAITVLKSIGSRVKILSTIGAGRTLISKGFLVEAKEQAKHLVDEINRIDPTGKLPVIGLEPSEVYTLRDEYLDMFPNDEYVEALSQRAFMIDEFLVRPGTNGSPRLSKRMTLDAINNIRTNVLIHGHCYQKAQPPAKDGFPTGVDATVAMLKSVGYSVTTIDDGCCGMAGAFGYEAEHYSLSMQVGDLSLFPTIKGSSTSIITAAGISCKSQIEDGTGRSVVHPISLMAAIGVKDKMGEG